MSILSRTQCSCHFFQIYNSIKNPIQKCRYYVKKNVNTVITILYYWPKKHNRIPFIPSFHTKITAFMSIFYENIVRSLKNILISCLYFVKKTSIFSKTRFSHVILFQLFHENPPVFMPIIGKKTPILSKLQHIMGQQRQ